MDEYSLDMNVFDMFTGEHHEIVSKNDDDSMSITNNLFHFEQTNDPDKCYLKNNNKNNSGTRRETWSLEQRSTVD
jgi:hypothetical protein